MRKALIVLIGGFASGIFFRSFFDLGVVFPAYALVLAAVLFFLVVSLKFSLKGPAFVAALILLGFALGAGRFELEEAVSDAHTLDWFVGREVMLDGVVVDEPDEREKNTRIVVQVNALSTPVLGEPTGEGVKVLGYVQRYPAFAYGDGIFLKGKLTKPKNLGDDFDWVGYLGKDEIFYVITNARADVVAHGKGNVIKEILFTIKRAFLGKLGELLPEPHAALMGGLLLGGKQALGVDIQEQFRRVGLTHVVVLSGYNVTIIADAILRAAAFLPSLLGLGFGVLGIIFFTLMTGAGPTIVRASVMAIIAVLARATGRVYAATTALIVAGFFMILGNPKLLVFDPSFQLSFLSTLGLIFFVPIIERYMRFIPARFGLREVATATIGVQLFVFPWLLYSMGDFSLVAPLSNVLVLAAIPATMFFGFLAGIIGFVSIAFATPFTWLTYALLAYELKVVAVFASLPFAVFELKHFPLVLVLCIYALYAFVIFFHREAKLTHI
jgi:competence protein ComEC